MGFIPCLTAAADSGYRTVRNGRAASVEATLFVWPRRPKDRREGLIMIRTNQAKRLCCSLFILAPGLLSCGCSSMSNTEAGAVGGGLVGAGAGAVVGHALGNTGAGALIGAGAGALTGGLIGNSQDEREKKVAE